MNIEYLTSKTENYAPFVVISEVNHRLIIRQSNAQKASVSDTKQIWTPDQKLILFSVPDHPPLFQAENLISSNTSKVVIIS